VNFGSRTNSCQQEDRRDRSPGVDPCVELERRAGIWRFDANRTGQAATSGERWATGIRNAVAIGADGSGQLWAAQHGRDQLLQNWAPMYDAEKSAELPAEELLKVDRGDDFGWPYCYFDHAQRQRVLAPEYGGDGGREVGRCADKEPPVVAFPGHWAPNALVFYGGSQFPARYRGGAFIAFHGSWNRAPLPQQGYRIAFVPPPVGQSGGALDGRAGFETFAEGFVDGTIQQPTQAEYRPSGLAVAPDGALFITDDKGGRIWRVVYTGGR
jgi:glucose/arabinose dehydrogenase